MEFVTESFRHAEVILNEPAYIAQYTQLLNIIAGVTDDDLIAKHESYSLALPEGRPKSLSVAINELLRERFTAAGWVAEAKIFHPAQYADKHWRLDFAKDDISIEVAFNHGEAIAWNLTKPVLASELNHVEKEIQTRIGVIIAATQGMKEAGGFDGAVGTYEKFLEYLPVMRNVLTAPLLIIGLCEPRTFRMVQRTNAKGRKYGVIERLE